MPANSAAAHFLVRRISRTYLRFAEGIRTVDTEGLDNYLSALEGFHEGRWRLIIPFRHIAKADAPVLGALFGQILPERLKGGDRRYWIHFLFGDMVLDWAGAGARWLFPQIGAVPVSNQRLVKEQIQSIRHLLTEGSHPLCMAPEGQVNYYNHRPGPLSNGLTHFIRWTVQGGGKLRLLPARIHYRYKNPEALINRALEETSAFTGTACPDLDGAIGSLLSFLLDYLGGGPPENPEGDREAIRHIIIEEARSSYPINGRTDLAELFLFRNFIFGELRKSSISVPAIMKRISAHWRDPGGLKGVERGYQRQQILDLMLNFDPGYHNCAPETDAPERLNRECEQALCLMDIMNRMKGGDINSRFFPQGTAATVHFCDPRDFGPADEPEKWVETFSGCR